MRIRPLTPDDDSAIEQIATLLQEGFDPPEAGWPDRRAALQEVKASLAGDRLSLLAEDESGVVLGWIGGISQYDGHVWELHPLIVHPSHRRRGVGRALVQALEREVAAIRNLRGHPYIFYRRLGFVIVGVLPDANGPGKPDIFMAKRVTS